MTLEELKRNLKYEMDKHKNDKVDTCDTNISAMCRDTLEVLEVVEKEIRVKAIDECIKELKIKGSIVNNVDLLCGYSCAITNLKHLKEVEQMKHTGLLKDTTELRKLIAEHPNYPICVLASEDANNGEYGWMYCASVRFEVGEMLDCEQPINNEIVFDDRDDFEQRLEEWLWEELEQSDIEESEFQKIFLREKAKYEPYWKDCIFIYADN